MKVFGLIGHPLSHSFSKGYFEEKFRREGIRDCVYENFPLPDIAQFPALLQQQPDLCGLNVTIPYKEAVLPWLDGLSPAAEQVKAVNCIQFHEGTLTGFNTDVTGFKRSLQPLLKPHHTHALILGTGGAAKAVKFVLQELNIPFMVVSRSAQPGVITYDALDKDIIAGHTIIINTSPLGMYPQTDTAPALPYECITRHHLLYDLIYNPAKTLFLQQGEAKGAAIKNGHEMLVLQAEASWDIWSNE
ncbi:shikimate dehydrogenase family protein [Chitinophaga japonensis]|uniref:Shikimate dehydrogenase n=1 Tax=Chitinophaga japonensis TaxID=104662 RepID=A0A562T4K2_CHIJA|nr:shikimate dehydrogenase [Chitinophaga japonensis]TWI88164.1 shikimate dehydrogenase [Chitinophaga japonensis]